MINEDVGEGGALICHITLKFDDCNQVQIRLYHSTKLNYRNFLIFLTSNLQITQIYKIIKTSQFNLFPLFFKGCNARKVNWGCIYSAYILKPVLFGRNLLTRIGGVPLLSEEVKSIKF